MTDSSRPNAGLAARLRRARPIADDLDRATDRLNEALSTFEQTLVAMRLGVTGRVVLRKEEQLSDTWYDELCFGKYDNRWALTIQGGLDDGEGVREERLLLRSNRELRLLAADALPKLVDALLANLEEKVAFVERRVDAVTDLTASLLDLVEGVE